MPVMVKDMQSLFVQNKQNETKNTYQPNRLHQKEFPLSKNEKLWGEKT